MAVESLGQRLRALREAEAVSLAQFAERLDVSRQHLYMLESGRKRVSPLRAVKFARALEQDEVYFLQLALQELVDDAGLAATVEVISRREGNPRRPSGSSPGAVEAHPRCR